MPIPNGAVSVSPSSTSRPRPGCPARGRRSAPRWSRGPGPGLGPCAGAPCRSCGTRSSAESNILMPRMSYSRLLPAPSGSVIVEMPMPSRRPRAFASSFCRRKSSYPIASSPTSRHLPYWPESVRKPNGVRCGKSSSRDEVERRNSAWSIPRSSAAACTMRSWKNIASVTRNEHGRRRRPAPCSCRHRGGEVGGRDVVAGEGRVHQPILNLLGCASEKKAPWSDGVHPDAEDLAVPAQRQLAVQVDVAGEPGRDQVAGPVLDPLHRPLQQDRGEDRHDVAGVDRHLVAEAAAEVGRDDPDHVLGQLGHQRHRGPDDVRRLRGHVDGQLRGRPVEVGDRPAALDRRGVRARVVQVELGDDVGLREGAVGAVLVADLPVEDDVVVLVLLVVTDDRRASASAWSG